MSSTPTKVHDTPIRRKARVRVLDRIFFGLGLVGALWLVVAILPDARLSWWSLLSLIAIWLVLAYLALPRLNRVLTAIYVPDYFIGRTRTSDGLLGDPLNLAIRGSDAQLVAALEKAGWILADPVDLRSSVGIIRATLTRRSYREAPVSPLLLFGRPQDAAYQQEVEGNPAQRHHVRIWRTPEGWPLPGGEYVDFLAGGTYDRRVGLSLFTLQVTHKIDANIDVERDYILKTVTEAEPRATVTVLKDFTTGYHARNGGGDSVHTDGNLPILDVRDVEVEDALVGGTPSHSLGHPVPDTMPASIWVPTVLGLLVLPFVLHTAFRDWPTDASQRFWTVAGVVGSIAVVLLSLLMYFRNSIARYLLLTVTAVVALVHEIGYRKAVHSGDRISHVLAASVAVLVLIALSSPRATAWTEGTR